MVAPLVVSHLLSRCRPSRSPGEQTDIMVFQGLVNREKKRKIWCFMPLLFTLITFARVQHSDRWSYLNSIYICISSTCNGITFTLNRLVLFNIQVCFTTRTNLSVHCDVSLSTYSMSAQSIIGPPAVYPQYGPSAGAWAHETTDTLPIITVSRH